MLLVYQQVKDHGVDDGATLLQFWESRAAQLRDVVIPKLWFPVSSAVVERSFSLAGV